VVSLSIGDTCRFRFGNPHNRGKPYTDIELVSGDAFVFGRESRFTYHGLLKIHPEPPNPLRLDHGRNTGAAFDDLLGQVRFICTSARRRVIVHIPRAAGCSSAVGHPCGEEVVTELAIQL
jgi:hypothetical protein